MKKKILIVICVLIILITLILVKLSYNTILNSILISRYNEGKFSTSLGQALTAFNFPQRYVANYNYGNILYQNGEYEQAIEQYKKALKGYIPEKKECKIRINYALAICNTVELDEESEESIKKAISIYESAIDVLTEKGCANKDDNNGHSQDAEQLKQDIQEEIERLKELLDSKSNQDNDEDNNDDNKNNNNNNNQNKNSPEDEKKEEELEKIMEDAIKQQRKNEDKYKNLNKSFAYKNNKNW